MWITFLQDAGQYRAGTFADVDENVSKTFIAMNYARLAPEDPTQRVMESMLSQVGALIDARMPTIPAPTTTRTVPLGRPIIHGTITPGESEVEKRRGPGGWLRSVINALGNPDGEARTAAHTELIRPWSEGGYGCSRSTNVEGTGTSGGYTTPVIYESQVFELASEQQVIIPYADERPLAAREVDWPALNQYFIPTAGQSAMFGGIQVYRKGETLHRVESNLSFKKIRMLAQDLTAYTTMSRDLIQDSTVSIDSYAVRMIGGAIGWREDWESINGNGAGQMLGYLNSPATLLIARNTSSHIKYQDVFKMKTRFMMQAASPCWICHPYALFDIETLVDGSGRFIYIAGGTVIGSGSSPTMPTPGAIQYKPAGYLLGWPIYTSEKVPQLGTQGDLSLIDRKMYWFGRRSGLEVGLSEHFLFDQDELAIRAKVRDDGKPGLLAPIYLADGSGANQVSGFVVLQ